MRLKARATAAALLLPLLLACAAAAAQEKKGEKSRPDLSGTWQLDRGKSDFGPFSERPLARADSTLAVEHKDPELKIRRTLSLNGRQEVKEFAYYADERGETNPAALGAGEVRSKTRWDGDKLVAEALVTRKGQQGPYELNITQRWQVSSDGKTLTNTTLIRNGTSAEQVKLVYRRAQQ